MKTYFKTIFRSIKNNFGRFFSVTFIILLGIAFVAGLGTLSPVVENSVNNHLLVGKAADIIVKGTSQSGISTEQSKEISLNENVAGTVEFFMSDMLEGEDNIRIYVMPSSQQINNLALLEGRMPTSDNEVVAERATKNMKSLAIDDSVNLFGYSQKVVGIVSNPLFFSKDGEVDIINQQLLDNIFYFKSDSLKANLPTTDIYVKLHNPNNYNVFSEKYHNYANAFADSITSNHADLKLLTLEDNKSSIMIKSYCDKIDVISLIFPIFFIAVAALVVLTTMTRLIEEERPIIGCFKTLGFSDGNIIFKYLSLAFMCCAIASIIGIIVGVVVLPMAIYPAFNTLFFIPPMAKTVSLTAGIISIIGMFAAVMLVTFYVVNKEQKGEPATILRPKAPKAGKKIFLEKISFIWKRLSFKYKSTFRNIFRFINHFLMTVISVAGSTALVFAGFALLDIAKSPEAGSTDFNSSFVPISVVVIIFALLLCGFVVYNLTNMNIGERKREIATLKVLGYHGGEVSGYIYRETFIMSLIGVIIGIPLGVALVAFVFGYLNFGSLADINWYSYLLSGGIVLLFVGIVDLLLKPKIGAIDMTSSLKSIE